ncbi:hypothetical protein BCR34DRAFT_352892 [Clohesyomyces aquaticus]|uniref:Uncharacterized protein n=1 Tax=Clohesyomyces aquaticus TaxID=1231657 RepID=A0A1Y1ZJC5_9PLEO|nr:hypothetical protein BCR34DRAFT_352892 [Clohesyomyces aquaticus]
MVVGPSAFPLSCSYPTAIPSSPFSCSCQACSPPPLLLTSPASAPTGGRQPACFRSVAQLPNSRDRECAWPGSWCSAVVAVIEGSLLLTRNAPWFQHSPGEGLHRPSANGMQMARNSQWRSLCRLARCPSLCQKYTQYPPSIYPSRSGLVAASRPAL